MYKFNDNSALLHLYSKHIFHQWRHRPIYNITLDTIHSAQYTGQKTDYFSNIKSTPSMILYLSPWIYNSYNKQTKNKTKTPMKLLSVYCTCSLLGYLCAVMQPDSLYVGWRFSLSWPGTFQVIWSPWFPSPHGSHVLKVYSFKEVNGGNNKSLQKKKKGICQKNKNCIQRKYIT